MEEWEVRQQERERIKETFSRLLQKYIDRRKATAKKLRTKGTLPIYQLKELEKEFFFNVDNSGFWKRDNWKQ